MEPTHIFLDFFSNEFIHPQKKNIFWEKELGQKSQTGNSESALHPSSEGVALVVVLQLYLVLVQQAVLELVVHRPIVGHEHDIAVFLVLIVVLVVDDPAAKVPELLSGYGGDLLVTLMREAGREGAYLGTCAEEEEDSAADRDDDQHADSDEAFGRAATRLQVLQRPYQEVDAKDALHWDRGGGNQKTQMLDFCCTQISMYLYLYVLSTAYIGNTCLLLLCV